MSILFHFKQKKKLKQNLKFSKFGPKMGQKWAKNGPKNADFGLFGPTNNCMVKMTTPYPSPYCALSSCKVLGKKNVPFMR